MVMTRRALVPVSRKWALQSLASLGGVGRRNFSSSPDFYKVLGVDKNASPEDIKKQYRLMAFKWHPDRCNNSPESVKKFQQISEAYQVLSDPEKRQNYDMFEGGSPNNFSSGRSYSQQQGPEVDPHEVFSRVFAGNFQQVLREMERQYRAQQAAGGGARRGGPFPEMDFMSMMGHQAPFGNRSREAEEEAILRMLFGFGKPSQFGGFSSSSSSSSSYSSGNGFEQVSVFVDGSGRTQTIRKYRDRNGNIVTEVKEGFQQQRPRSPFSPFGRLQFEEEPPQEERKGLLSRLASGAVNVAKTGLSWVGEGLKKAGEEIKKLTQK